MSRNFHLVLAATVSFLIGGIAVAEPLSNGSPATSSSPDSDHGKPNTGEYNCDPHKMRFYPEKAQMQGQTGFAIVQCLIKDDGRLQNCISLSEAPGGYGFGAKAVEMATCIYHMKLGPDGKAIGAGALFKKRIDFKLQ
jgi:TonB family protein